MAAYIYVGAQFADFDSLEHCITEYEKENHVTLYKREARTIKTMRSKIVRMNKQNQISDERMEQLKYYSIRYSCIYGGRTFVSRLPKESIPRRKTKTYRQDCPAQIRVLLSEDQDHLRIVQVRSEHNHVVSEEINKRLPKHRRLAKDEEEKVKNLLKLKVDKKLLLQQIRQETGKLVTNKDLNNIASRCKKLEEPLIANPSSIPNIVEIIPPDMSAASSSMAAFTPLTEAPVIEGATLSELGATVIEDHTYDGQETLTEIGEIERPRVCLVKEYQRSNEQAQLKLLKEIESRKLKIEEEKLLLKSTKIRLLEEQNQLLKQLIDKIN